MKKVLYIVIFLVIILAIGGYLASNYAISYVLKNLGSSELAIEKSSETDVNAADEQKSYTSTTEQQQNNKNTSSSSSSSGKAEIGDELVKVEKASSSKDDSNRNGQVQDNKRSEKEEQQDVVPTQELKYSAEVSQDKAKAVEQSITTREKAKIITMLINKLSADELQLFLKMSGDGLSVEEKKEAKKIILKKLTEDEYNQLIAIAAKYGLSQGKSYKESQKE